jgi:hypothetical protein
VTEPKFLTSKDAKAAGWFSRRHESADAHLESRARYQEKARPAARIARRKRRSAEQ